MKIISIDVGIKNLSFCLFENTFDNKLKNFIIKKWDIINLMEKEKIQCSTKDCGNEVKDLLYKNNLSPWIPSCVYKSEMLLINFDICKNSYSLTLL